eukprot:gene11309-2057_t
MGTPGSLLSNRPKASVVQCRQRTRLFWRALQALNACALLIATDPATISDTTYDVLPHVSPDYHRIAASFPLPKGTGVGQAPHRGDPGTPPHPATDPAAGPGMDGPAPRPPDPDILTQHCRPHHRPAPTSYT